MPFRPEPEHRHGAAPRVGILYVNLGTPDAPTPSAVRRYLAQFLSDPRVVEIPRAVWWPILHGVILRTRPAKSAAKYAGIWTKDGSPLLVHTVKQAKLLQGWLGEQGFPLRVMPAMRYGQPSIAAGLDALRADGADRILVLPAYPQYAGSTTASAIDAVADWARGARHVPELRLVNRFHDDPGYIDALAASVREHWKANGRGRLLLMSFHGVPERTLHLGDPYHCECLKTGRLLAERLQLAPDEFRIAFQSRFGRAKWLEPATEPTAQQLAREGHPRLDVICPGFTADCLETLEEIAQEVRDAFLAAGGREYHYIPCLNERPDAIGALGRIALRHLQGWTLPPPDEAALARQRERALTRGASR